MRHSKKLQFILTSILFFSISCFYAQINPGVYLYEDGNIQHELKVAESYLVHSIYEKSPPKFIKTVGGFYTAEENNLKLTLEFNSDFEKDSIQTLEIAIQLDGNTLVLGSETKMIFEQQESKKQDLDGAWLFATRGPDEGQKRRGEANTRKTLKFLKDGRFQWIAFDTEGMKFKGSGGGSYTSNNGIYTENIEYFSRDNSRVGASLEFNYELKEGDWHHTGKNSKGKPMYEIWAQRK